MSNAWSLAILFLPVFGLTVAANLVERRGESRQQRLFSWLLAALNVPLLIIGLLFLLAPAQIAGLADSPEFIINDPVLFGAVLVATGLWTVASCSHRFRLFLGRFIPLDSTSMVQMTALIFAGYLVGNTALALSQQYLDQLSEINAELELAVSSTEIALQQAAFVALAYAGSGLLIRRDLKEVNRRLGLLMPTGQQLIIAVGAIILLLFVQATIGGLWAFLNPQAAQELGSINEALLTGFDTVGEWLVLATASGIGEEVLFRGALQPIFGLPGTALLFAIVHIQYGLTPITIAVFLLGLILGIVRRYTNTTVAIVVHFGYNFSLGLLSMLALYLEQFVTP